VHHHAPRVHWSDMPQNFEDNIERYNECRATIFGDCEQGDLFYWLMGTKWDGLTSSFVDLQYIISDGRTNCAVDTRMTVKQVADHERKLAS